MTAQLKPSATGKYQQSIKTSSCKADMERKHHTVKGQAEAGRVPRYQRQPQGFRQPAEFIRGPNQRRAERRTAVREISIDVEDSDFKRGPVQRKKLWTPPSRNNRQHAAAKPQQADRVNTCNQVKARPRTTIHVPQQHVNNKIKLTTEPKGDDDMSYLEVLNMLRGKTGKTCIVIEASTQATTQVPQTELQQPSVRETEQATTPKTKDEASAALLEQLKRMQAQPCNKAEASPQQAMIYVSEREHQQFQRQTDRITQLKNGNEALAAEMEQLKKMLQMNKTLHDETTLKRMDEVKDLELRLSEKKASEAEALRNVQELEKTLQRQKDRRAEQDILLAQQEEDITKLKTALVQKQDELKSRQVHRQEERSLLEENLREIQRALQEEKATQESRQKMKRVEKSPSLEKGSPSSLTKLEATKSPQANPPLTHSSSMPTTDPTITSS